MKTMEYRVWCEEEQIYVEGPLVNGTTGKVCGTGTYEIELFTGKLDKTGRKIYENDILFAEDQDGNRTFYVVSWRNGLLVLEGKNGIDGIVWIGSNLTILSNIHEWKAEQKITICFTAGDRDRKLRGPCSFFASSGELVNLEGWDPGNEPRLAGFAPKVGMAMKSLDTFSWSQTLEGMHRLIDQLIDHPVPVLVYRKDGPVCWNPEDLRIDVTYEDETVLSVRHKKGADEYCTIAAAVEMKQGENNADR